MPTLEMEVGDAVLDRQAEQAYQQRQQGRIAQWQEKASILKALKLEGREPEEVARIKEDLRICASEVEKIQAELKLAAQLNSPGLARQQIKRPLPAKRLRA